MGVFRFAWVSILDVIYGLLEALVTWNVRR
jgi:hypothetical protein